MSRAVSRPQGAGQGISRPRARGRVFAPAGARYFWPLSQKYPKGQLGERDFVLPLPPSPSLNDRRGASAPLWNPPAGANSLGDSKGESGAAPPVADAASRFQGSAPVPFPRGIPKGAAAPSWSPDGGQGGRGIDPLPPCGAFAYFCRRGQKSVAPAGAKSLPRAPWARNPPLDKISKTAIIGHGKLFSSAHPLPEEKKNPAACQSGGVLFIDKISHICYTCFAGSSLQQGYYIKSGAVLARITFERR